MSFEVKESVAVRIYFEKNNYYEERVTKRECVKVIDNNVSKVTLVSKIISMLIHTGTTHERGIEFNAVKIYGEEKTQYDFIPISVASSIPNNSGVKR